MKTPRQSSPSLLWRIILSTSIALTVLFAITGWIVQEQFVRSASATLEDEVRGSFQSYESLWKARAGKLASLSLVLSLMSDVRAAFGTGDRATIRDTAGEIWRRIAEEDAIFVVTEPNGSIIASLGGYPETAQESDRSMVTAAASSFPEQAAGFRCEHGRLYQTVITPVYVAATHGSALLNVLVAGYDVNTRLARQLKEATGGSDFIFFCEGRAVASSLGTGYPISLQPAAPRGDALPHVFIDRTEYAQFTSPLLDIQGRRIGELRILRSFDAARARIDALRLNMIGVWLIAVLAGLWLTYQLARRILEPVRALDAAAAEIGRGNYDIRVPVTSDDELGRLGQTFDGMCQSIKAAREELIRQERLSTISRLSTSIVHDLRNPLAAIYGGAEMLVDDDLPGQQVKRLAVNIYRSSRRVQELLSDLADVTRGRTRAAEPCNLFEVIDAARSILSAEAERHSVSVRIDVPRNLTLQLERSRIERVFENLLANSIEAMPTGGTVDVTAVVDPESIVVTVQDSGPGLPEGLHAHLFEPFTTTGKRKGMGLGLALSRQAVLDHTGDLWADPPNGNGARFHVRFPR